jgi:steroid delta-isomerase-like uncharacterized protein
MDRRNFLKYSGVGALGIAGSGLINAALPSVANAGGGEMNETWSRYNFSNRFDSLTIAAKEMPRREDLLKRAMQRIPSQDRIEQIHNIVVAHTAAEENNDVDTTMATMIEKPIYEDVASGKTFIGHQDVMEDYRQRFQAFPSMKRHVTNMMVDSEGCFIEIIWEGEQKGVVKGLKPSANRPKLYLPVSVYYAVNHDGKIERETVYYDQYLMMLNLEIIPDIANKPVTLAMLNPGLVRRKK